MDQKHKSQQKVITIIVAIIVIAGLAYVFSKAQNSKNAQTPTNSSTPTVAVSSNVGGGPDNSAKSLLSFDGKVAYAEVKDGVTNIYTKTAQDNAKLIFTDKDESDKIKFLGGLTSNGEILVVFAPADAQFGGVLYLIKTDGSGIKTKIIDEFASPHAPKISPDSRSIAYILFSNTEADYGFSLYIMNASGQNKIKIDQDPTLLANIAWSSDSAKITYIKGNNPKMRITTSDVDAGNQNDIYQIPEGQTASSLNWTSNNIIIAQNNISGEASSEILSINPKTQKKENIYKSNQYIAQSFWASKEEDKFFFLTGDKNENRGLYKLNIATSSVDVANLGEGSAIIGWLP